MANQPSFLPSPDGQIPQDKRFQPLFDGCTTSKLEGTILLLDAFGKHPGATQALITDVLKVMTSKLMPTRNTMPSSYHAAKNVTADFIAPSRKIDVCINDCFIFYGEAAEMDSCPKCGETRKDDKGKSKKSFHYLPLIPRIRSWFQSQEIAAALRAHEDTYDNSFFRSRKWTNLYSPEGPFAGDKRCLSLAICADGFDPFSITRVQYSMTPVIVRCMNLPATLRDKIGMMVLTVLIPGKSAPKEMAPYLQPLVEELHQLGEGVNTFDVVKGKNFKLKAQMIFGVFDTPGKAKFTKSAGVGSLTGACSHCTQKGTYVKGLSRTLYLDASRFLPENHPLRGDERRPPPQEHDREKLLSDGQAIENETNPAKKRRLQKASGKNGADSLAGIPGYLEMDFPVDVMHTLQVVAKRFHSIFTGHEMSAKVREYETDVRNGNVGDYLLTTAQQKEADRRLLEIQVPADFGWTPKQMFRGKTPYTKCHEWKQISVHGILKYAIRGLLGPAQQDALFTYLDVLTKICNSVLPEDVDQIELELHESIVKIEQHFPLMTQTLCLHKMQHVPADLKDYGNVQATWMYPFERFMCFLKGRISNRKDPEACAVQNYLLYEAMTFLRLSGVMSECNDQNDHVEMLSGDEQGGKNHVRIQRQRDGAIYRAGSIVVANGRVGRVTQVCKQEGEALAEVAWFQAVHSDDDFQWVHDVPGDKSMARIDDLSRPAVHALPKDRVYLLNIRT